MKRTFTLLALAAGLTAAAQTTYNGNGRTGFGAVIGTGNLVVAQTPTAINFTLNKGNGDLNDIVVIYMDSKTGGFANTNAMLDNAGDRRGATSGTSKDNASERAPLIFPTNFLPDYALALQFDAAGNGGTLFELANGGPNSLIAVGGTGAVAILPAAGKTAPTYTFSVPRALLALPTNNAGFKFIATYVSPTAYRSDEAIGFAVTGQFPNCCGAPALIDNINRNSFNVPAFATYNDAVLSTKLSSFGAQQVDGGVTLKWTTSTEENLREFVVEKLTGGDFAAAGTVRASNASNGAAYSFVDRGVAGSSSQYRLKLVNLDGTYSYSQIVQVKVDGLAGVKVYPTHVRSGDLVYVQANPTVPEKAELRIVNNSGITVLRQALTLSGGTAQSIRLPQLVRGSYWLQIALNGETTTQQLIVD